METTQPCPSVSGKRNHPSSYEAETAARVFRDLGLQSGDVFLDAGCGLGEYALAAVRLVGPAGLVYAFDTHVGCIEDLSRQAIPRLRAQVVDITQGLPLPADAVTACLLATVVHMPCVRQAMARVFAEIHRVLRPGGRLGLIEGNQHAFFGPPLPLRLAARRVTNALTACGFRSLALTELGYNYLALFQKEEPPRT